MSGKVRKLCVVVPHRPQGEAKTMLMWWLAAIEVQASTRRAFHAAKSRMHDVADRLLLGEMAEVSGRDWPVLRARWEGAPPEMRKMMSKTMLPENWDVFCTSHGGSPVPVNRNEIVVRFLREANHEEKRYDETDFDALLMIDSDMVPPHDALVRICALLDREDCDVASGIYCMSTPEGPAPILYTGLGTGGGGNRFAQEVLATRETEIEVDDAAFPGGFLAVKRYVFEEMLKHDMVWFKDRWADASFECWELRGLAERHPDPEEFRKELLRLVDLRVEHDLGQWARIGSWDIGEDVWFCSRARELGFRFWTSKHLFCQHFKEVELKAAFGQLEGAVVRGWDTRVEAAEKGYDDFNEWMSFRARHFAEQQEATHAAKSMLRKLKNEGQEDEEQEEDDRREPEGIREGVEQG